MSGEIYSYESDQITADMFLHPLPSALNTTCGDGVRDADYMLNWMEAFESYNSEEYQDSQYYPSQDCYQFNSDPFSFSQEGDLLWKQFEDPVYPETDLNYQPFTFPEYPLQDTQPSSTVESSITQSSQASSPVFSPDDSPASLTDSPTTKIGNERRKYTHTYQEDPSPPVVQRKRTRGQRDNTSQINSDHGYESMSSENISSPPYDPTLNNNKQKSPGVVTSVTRVIDGMIDKFSKSQVKLTEEEIEALHTAGLPIPTTLPLTKIEQNALKDVRRKLKNKQAAMENRRRKKEYVSELETKVADFEKQVSSLEERMNRIEREKQALETEVKKFRRESKLAKGSRSDNLQTGACLMVFVLCFGLVCGTWFTGFGQLGDTSLYQLNIKHSLSSTHNSRTLLDSTQIQQTTFEWVSDSLTSLYNEFISHFNSNSNYVSIMDLETSPCNNDSCVM
ncbi:Cyclic AMP-responsive element-binding protein 3-like protein 2 [Oopsacas minuta]|uniref:Cyclic AMP-responsive element-binding protein 3-like protein 2 n=1 Tax=Oopsacas minuta TaxID=111878 RepID=A0AAV7JQE9_9METZ|nr:Cyclic AMP-responsive element-binding protein 3-like protein 2 [Oopsacas minuta]